MPERLILFSPIEDLIQWMTDNVDCPNAQLKRIIHPSNLHGGEERRLRDLAHQHNFVCLIERGTEPHQARIELIKAQNRLVAQPVRSR